MPLSVLCHLPRREGIHRGAHSSWPYWPPVVNDALGDPKTCGYVCWQEQRRDPTFPFSQTFMLPCHAWPSACDQTDHRPRVRWKCLSRERAHIKLSLSRPAQAPYPTVPQPVFFFFFYWGQFRGQRILKNGAKMPGQFKSCVLVALPWIDPLLGIYPCCKYHKTLLVKINRQKCTNSQKRY